MKNKGFTLTEVLAVIVVLAIIIVIALPTYNVISKNVKENNYKNKKSTLEMAAVKYATENNLDKPIIITATKLVLDNYYKAEKYEDDQMPFISNPLKANENLACRIIDISLDGYDYDATVLEDSNCVLSQNEIDDEKIGVEAYKLSGNTIKERIGSIQNELNWTNTDVLVVVKPVSTLSNFTNISYTMFGNTKTKAKTLNNCSYSTGSSVSNIDNCYNLYRVDAALFLNQELNITVVSNNVNKTKNVTVRIDKEKPIVMEDKENSTSSKRKDISVLATDGSGSGVKKIQYLLKNEYQSNPNMTKKDATTSGSNGYVKGTISGNLRNGTYLIWAFDAVNNMSDPLELVVDNLDVTPPTVSINYTLDTDVGRVSNITYDRSRTAKLTIRDDETGVASVKYCIANGSATCTPTTTLNGSNDVYSVSFRTQKDGQRLCYSAVDNNGNEKKDCTSTFYVDGSAPSISNVSFNNSNETLNATASDSESGILRVDYYVGSLSNSNTYSSGTYATSFSYSFYGNIAYNTNYSTSVVVTNKANSKATRSGSSVSKSLTVQDAYNNCSQYNNYCTKKVYLKYGNITFLVYRSHGGTIKAFAIDNFAQTSRVPVSCCDTGYCKMAYVGNTDQDGIYGNKRYSVKYTYESLPYNRNSVTDSYNFYVDYISTSCYKKGSCTGTESLAYNPNNSAHPIIKNDDKILAWDTLIDDSLGGDVLIDDSRGGDVLIDDSRGDALIDTSDDIILIGTDDLLTDSDILIADERDIIWDELISDVIIEDVVIEENKQNWYNKTLKYRKKKDVYAHYGLLTLEEYAQIYRNGLVPNSMKTLLSTVVNGLAYNKNNYGNEWAYAYGDENKHSSLTGLFVKGKYMYATTPMYAARGSASMVLPFRPSTKITAGNGTQSSPYIIEQ